MKRGSYLLILFSLLLTCIIALLYYQYYYKPDHEQLIQVTDKIENLNNEILNEENAVNSTKKEIVTMDLGLVHLNFFNSHTLENEYKIPFFLKSINNHANKIGVRIIAITPEKTETKNGYIKESFEIQMKADFYRFLSFLDEIQNDLGLNIDSLSILSEDPLKPSETTMALKLNTLEMTDSSDQKVKTLSDLRKNHRENDPALKDIHLNYAEKPENDLSDAYFSNTMARDPFEKPQKIQKIQEKLMQIEKELKESELLGIMNFNGQKHAIIGRHTVKKGDRLFNMEVLEIMPDSVVLGYGEFRFTYKIKKDIETLIKK